MKNTNQYTCQFFPVENPPMRWATKNKLETPPIWCSVDLRDGNQALITPMNLEEKLEFFSHLVRIGFKEIEIGFPAASETEYQFCRTLIEQNLIPDDVTIQVLTQAREHIIDKTFDALKGAKNAIIHLYNSTSKAQREQVFHKSKEEIIAIAVEGAKYCEKCRAKTQGNFRFEYSPESFTGTEPDFALEICNAVLDVWKPSAERPVIINLPVTVSHSMPHVYANQIEFMSDNLHYRDNVIISLHPHNDRGCAVADSELGLLAGGQRIEGTLFGNGERTGNVDIITLAMNLYSQGVDPNLDLSDMPRLVDVYERVTRMHVYERSPYSGQLVFAAFSGSHQDAIAKGMRYREEHNCQHWTVPYLPINPQDVGREYETDVIRINSQSGKGGIGYLMESQYGYQMPPKMRESFGYLVKGISDHAHKELRPAEVFAIFEEHYINVSTPIALPEVHYVQLGSGDIEAKVTVKYHGETTEISGIGNGRLDAVAKAMSDYLAIDFEVTTYTEHALAGQTDSKAVTYVGIDKNKKTFWGVGVDDDIINSSILALVSALNDAVEA